jgi:ADP-heptose:LPS heptosyltransferase
MNLAEAIEEHTQEKVVFYTRYPDVIRNLSSLDARDERIFISTGADWWITLNTLVLFNFQKNFRGFRNHKIEEMFFAYSAFLSNGNWKLINEMQPHMENMTGIEAVKLGLNRRTLISDMLGIKVKEKKRNLKKIPRVLDKPFITLHTGFDDANKVSGRSTKNWKEGNWAKLVELLKKINVCTVQIGGATSFKIPGVDYDMVGKTSLLEALGILSKSTLHVDGESGFVHAAYMFGVKSIVLFGPTNLKFFSYPENINIAPKFCADEGSCWWLTDSWVAKCPLGYLEPLCIDSIPVEEVFENIRKELNGKT